MKKLQLVPYRECDRRLILKKHYIVTVQKAKNGDLLIPIPDDIVKAYHIEAGDVAIFDIVNKNSFKVRFVKKTMCSFVEADKDIKGREYETWRSIK